ncbi:cytoskeletal protein binding protein [Podila epigama]|nr:cytoskeletal protein binding protein [Podila epigama]
MSSQRNPHGPHDNDDNDSLDDWCEVDLIQELQQYSLFSSFSSSPDSASTSNTPTTTETILENRENKPKTQGSESGLVSTSESAAATAEPSMASSVETPALPTPAITRLWKDSSGRHKTKATLTGVRQGHVELLKTNGVLISVPLEKLSRADRKLIEHIERGEYDTEATAALTGDPEGKDYIDWLEFFLTKAKINKVDAGVYAHTFANQNVGQDIFTDINKDILKDLGVKIGDVVRVMKAVTGTSGYEPTPVVSSVATTTTTNTTSTAISVAQDNDNNGEEVSKPIDTQTQPSSPISQLSQLALLDEPTKSHPGRYSCIPPQTKQPTSTSEKWCVQDVRYVQQNLAPPPPPLVPVMPPPRPLARHEMLSV